MKRVTILAAVMATMVAGGAMAQNDSQHWTPHNVTNNSTSGSQVVIPPGFGFFSSPQCQSEVYLYRYTFIGWNGYVPNRVVGASQEKVGTEARLKELKDEYVAACAVYGNEMMAKTKKKLEDDHNRRMADWGDFWGSWVKQWVTRTYNDNVANVTRWYQERIRTCQQSFTNDYNALRREFCP